MMRGANFGRDIWKRALDTAELGHVRVHDLRHTCASLMIQVGAHPKAIQLQTGPRLHRGHMNLYGHLSPDHMETQAAKGGEAYGSIHTGTAEPDAPLFQVGG